MIEIEGVSKSYNKGKVKAVDNLNLTIKPGEIFGFLGPNGAGKSTTIKMIVGLLKPDSGTIRIKGMDNRKKSLRCKAITSYVPENPETYERLTGMEYLNFMGDVYGVPGADRTTVISQLLETFGLEKAVNNPIKSYSHGMRQKIILLGALIPSSDVFILDEPLIGLDPKSAHSLKTIMRQHCDQGKTLFFSTHVMEVAEKLCDRIGIISKGQLIACGTMDQLREQSKSTHSLENIFLELTEQ
ncbi:MAG: ABC transporter ATP-binding protein [bacterium]|nr:ABC transporter ATP-binding protein [bacterium]